jgi:hypothetical protein
VIFDTYQIIGWAGMILLILAYFLLSIKKIKSHSLVYHMLNLFGAVGIAVSAFATSSWPSVVLNIIWFGIAAFSLYKVFTTKPTYKELE